MDKRPTYDSISKEREASPEHWLDFEVEVSSRRGRKPKVQVLRSGKNRPEAPFAAPYPTSAVQPLLEKLSQRLKRDVALRDGSLAKFPQIAARAETCPPPEAIGAQLFEAIFPGEVRDALVATRESQRENKAGLRLRISFDAGSNSLISQAALPWEILFEKERGEFFGRDPAVAIERYVDAAVRLRWFPITDRLRILLVASEPHDQKPAGAREERQRIHHVLRQDEHVEVVMAHTATFAGVCELLAKEEYHVLHFMGHGGFNGKKGRGALCFENDDGTTDLVYAADLAQAIGRLPKLRLVVLNACSSGALRSRPSYEALGSLAIALLEAGLPAVVGMQFAVSIDGAGVFGKTFYQELARSGSIDSALAVARTALASFGDSSLEWVTPVLFSRVQSGKLFDPLEVASRDAPRRIGIQSFIGWGPDTEKWSQVFLPLTRYFRDRCVAAGVDWTRDVYADLRSFLLSEIPDRGEVHLQMPVHQTIAYAMGQVLQAKSGLAVVIRQRGIRGTDDWDIRSLTDPGAWSWAESMHPCHAEGLDLAFAIGPTRMVLPAAELHVKKHLPGVSKVVLFTPPEGIEPGQSSVKNGWHAHQLATIISNRMDQLAGEMPGRCFHLFYSGPNALFFYLARLVRPGLDVQLYEFDFDGKGGYTPSLRFPVET